jgi:hypothetical protein
MGAGLDAITSASSGRMAAAAAGRDALSSESEPSAMATMLPLDREWWNGKGGTFFLKEGAMNSEACVERSARDAACIDGANPSHQPDSDYSTVAATPSAALIRHPSRSEPRDAVAAILWAYSTQGGLKR